MSWFNLNNTTPIQPHQEGTAASSKLHLFGGRGVSYFQHTRSSTIWRRPLWLWRSCGGWFRTTRWIVVVSRVTCVSGLSEFFSGCWKMIIWREICFANVCQWLLFKSNGCLDLGSLRMKMKLKTRTKPWFSMVFQEWKGNWMETYMILVYQIPFQS